MHKIKISTKYNKPIKNTNNKINSINSNNIHNEIYNYIPFDTKLNKVLADFYQQFYNFYISNNNNNNNNDLLGLKIDLMKPILVTDNLSNLILHFNTNNISYIYSNECPNTTCTQFTLTEMKCIDKSYAYTTLLFPSYDSDGEKTYPYLIGCIMVAYLLKNRIQNYNQYISEKIVGTKAEITCMVTYDVDDNIIDILNKYFDKIIKVPYITWSLSSKYNICINNVKSIIINDITGGHIDDSHIYGRVTTKLNIFNKNLFPYEKVIFIDSDLFPLGYYDSLFSLDCPAGCLEHRRTQNDSFGISSWALDRGNFMIHGQKILKMFTDIENIYAADINASLLIIKPDENIFNEIINELQNNIFNNNNKYKGFWLGNNYYNFYYLPEQNYLTQKFSGDWHSIDMGFSSWLVDLNNCFGFTFAGFVIKPWAFQSINHNYSINPYSLFSKINNKNTNRSLGYQTFNMLLYEILKNNDHLLYYISDMTFINSKFDPWEPEMNLNLFSDKIKITDITINNFNNLSYDQKLLASLFINKNINKINLDICIDKTYNLLTRYIYNIDHIALLYHLSNILFQIIKKNKIFDDLYPFGNTLTAINNFNSFDITDDDNDFILILKNNSHKNKILNIIKELLDKKLQIYAYSLSLNQFVQVLSNDIQPSYYFFENKYQNNNYTNIHIIFDEFSNNFDMYDMSYINISFYKSQIDQIYYDLNTNITHNMFNNFNNNSFIKLPCIDLFFIIDIDNNMNFKANSVVNFIDKLFNNNFTKKIDILNTNIRVPDYNKYVMNYYKDDSRINKILIRTTHSNLKKEILFSFNKTDFKFTLYKYIYKNINDNIKIIYDSINIDSYLT